MTDMTPTSNFGPTGPVSDVCVLFADIVDSTALANALALEDYGDVMSDAVQLMILICEAAGGEVLQHQGDAVLAVWSEAHRSFSLGAALELHERLGRLVAATRRGLKLRAHVGVSSGEVVFRDVAGARTAYGLPLNLARRLCDAAQADEVLICERTAEGAPLGTLGRTRSLQPRGFPMLRASNLVALPTTDEMKIG